MEGGEPNMIHKQNQMSQSVFQMNNIITLKEQDRTQERTNPLTFKKICIYLFER